MAESTTEPRPTRKLTVKNFSVIREAELEFGRITVLIGPQASGKSLLCKLAYFFQYIVIEQAEASIRAVETFASFKMRVWAQFFRWFQPESQIVGASSEVSYTDCGYGIKILTGRRQHLETMLAIELSDEIKRCYNRLQRKIVRERSVERAVVNIKAYEKQLGDELRSLQSPNTPEIYSYIPSIRSFFVNLQKAVLGTASRSDEILVRFSQDFDYSFENAIPKSGREHSLAKWIDSEGERILQGRIIAKGNDFEFVSNDGRILSLAVLSSGTQELLPLVTCLREFVAASAAVAKTLDLPNALHRRLFFLEEPESNVFPSTQYDLVRIFARMANEPVLDAYWVITTHSPYVLSSFNNLIEAGQAARNNPTLQSRIAKIIPEEYWIKEGSFKAFSIQDGKLESILNENGFVEGNYLDQVSETISDEFDRLIKLEYDHAKAS